MNNAYGSRNLRYFKISSLTADGIYFARYALRTWGNSVPILSSLFLLAYIEPKYCQPWAFPDGLKIIENLKNNSPNTFNLNATSLLAKLGHG